MWIILAAGTAVVVVVAIARWRTTRESDLGWVTERWLAEYRPINRRTRNSAPEFYERSSSAALLWK